MLKTPELLFISCLGSYYYSIVQEKQENGVNPLLNYLVGTELKFLGEDIDEIQNIKGDNPWRYQPVEILRGEEKVEIDAKFMDYVTSEFNIITEVHKVCDGRFINDVIRDFQQGFCCICKVDEYHIKHSKAFYKKNSNRHYLLIRDIDYEKECFVVIDSETDIIYAVTFKEMEEAVLKNTFRNKLYYRINCDNYTWNRRVPVDENLIKVDYLYVSQMIECLKNTPEKNLVYLVKGYRYNIISKIIPYITAQEYYFIEAKKSDISTILHSIIDMWKKVNILISYEIKKNTFDFELIGKRLGQIEDYYKKNSKELQV